jgi:hypothetical protein
MLCGDERGVSAQQPEDLVKHNKIFCGQERHFGFEALGLGNGVQCTWVKILASLSFCILQVTALGGVAKDS